MNVKCFYATFGLAHPLRNRVQRILAPDYGGDATFEELARRTMNSFYGDRWAFLYGPFDVKDSETVVLAGEVYLLVDNDLEAGEAYE